MSSNKEYIKSSKLQFPTITICPFNFYNQIKIESLAVAYGTTPQDFIDMINEMNSSTVTQDFFDFLANQGIYTIYEFHNAAKLTMEDIRETDVSIFPECQY